MQVIQYKGWGQLYVPHSELAALVHNPASTKYFDPTTMQMLLDRLDMALEGDVGYTYEAALKSFPAASGSAGHQLQHATPGFLHVDPLNNTSSA